MIPKELIYRERTHIEELITESHLWEDVYNDLYKSEFVQNFLNIFHIDCDPIIVFNEVYYQCVRVKLNLKHCFNSENDTNLYISVNTPYVKQREFLCLSLVFVVLSLSKTRKEHHVQDYLKTLKDFLGGWTIFPKILNYISNNCKKYTMDIIPQAEYPYRLKNKSSEWWETLTNCFAEENVIEVLNYWSTKYAKWEILCLIIDAREKRAKRIDVKACNFNKISCEVIHGHKGIGDKELERTRILRHFIDAIIQYGEGLSSKSSADVIRNMLSVKHFNGYIDETVITEVMQERINNLGKKRTKVQNNITINTEGGTAIIGGHFRHSTFNNNKLLPQ